MFDKFKIIKTIVEPIMIFVMNIMGQWWRFSCFKPPDYVCSKGIPAFPTSRVVWLIHPHTARGIGISVVPRIGNPNLSGSMKFAVWASFLTGKHAPTITMGI